MQLYAMGKNCARDWHNLQLIHLHLPVDITSCTVAAFQATSVSCLEVEFAIHTIYMR